MSHLGSCLRFVLVNLIAIQAQASLPTSALSFKALTQKVKAIRPNPNLSNDQAFAIFWLYYSLYIHQHCLPTEIEDNNEFWSWKPPSNASCEPDPAPILLHKSTGRITWRNGPSYESLQALVRAALTKRSARTPPLPSSELP